MLMTQKRYEYWGGRNLRNCMCCHGRVKVGQRFIPVSNKGIQHERGNDCQDFQKEKEGIMIKENVTIVERQNVDTRLREMRRVITRAITEVDPEVGNPLDEGKLDGLLNVVDVHMQAINANLGRK